MRACVKRNFRLSIATKPTMLLPRLASDILGFAWQNVIALL